jgi:hypothetical protein
VIRRFPRPQRRIVFMRFLEISKRVCINVDEICWVENSEDGLTCTIYAGDREYPCEIPYNALVNMLKQADAPEKGHDNFHFAG